jgi:hydroxymethylpyrimidine/phosphomethylpyrimidine kinase
MTRQEAPVSPPVVLTIAGSDSGGGAGIQADCKTIEAGGGFGTSAITSVTAQNTTGVQSTHLLPVEEIDAQIEAVRSDFDVAAVKTGMLATSEVIDLVTDHVREMDVPVVVDPVMVAASGDRLLATEAEDAYQKLIAGSTLVTPNADEAAVLTGIDPEDASDARDAGERLVEAGAPAALVKGGHLPGDEVVDVLVTRHEVERFRHERVQTTATHGSGCTLSSAIATRLANGDGLVGAVDAGVSLLARAVRYHHDVGEGPGAVHHLVETRNEAVRDRTAEAVASVVEAFVDRDLAGLVPEVGTNVVGATPYAERPDETTAVEGRIARTLSGVSPNRGVRFGASSRVARALLAAREFEPGFRFGANFRLDGACDRALDALDGPVAGFDRDSDHDGPKGREAVVGRGVGRAFESAPGSPVAVLDYGGYAAEPMVFVLAAGPDRLVRRTDAILDAMDGTG